MTTTTDLSSVGAGARWVPVPRLPHGRAAYRFLRVGDRVVTRAGRRRHELTSPPSLERRFADHREAVAAETKHVATGRSTGRRLRLDDQRVVVEELCVDDVDRTETIADPRLWGGGVNPRGEISDARWGTFPCEWPHMLGLPLSQSSAERSPSVAFMPSDTPGGVLTVIQMHTWFDAEVVFPIFLTGESAATSRSAVTLLADLTVTPSPTLVLLRELMGRPVLDHAELAGLLLAAHLGITPGSPAVLGQLAATSPHLPFEALGAAVMAATA